MTRLSLDSYLLGCLSSKLAAAGPGSARTCRSRLASVGQERRRFGRSHRATLPGVSARNWSFIAGCPDWVASALGRGRPSQGLNPGGDVEIYLIGRGVAWPASSAIPKTTIQTPATP
jgi:hypothetical protein